MRRLVVGGIAAVGLLLVAAPPSWPLGAKGSGLAHAEDDKDEPPRASRSGPRVPIPRRARRLEPNIYNSPWTFRNTVDYYGTFLKRRAIPHRAVPVYAYRGTVVARFLSDDPRSKWIAIQVFREGGKTRIAILPRQSLDEPADAE